MSDTYKAVEARVEALRASIREADAAIAAWSAKRANDVAELKALGVAVQVRLPNPGTQAHMVLHLAKDRDVGIQDVARALGRSYEYAAKVLRDLVARDLLYKPSRGVYRTRHRVAQDLSLES